MEDDKLKNKNFFDALKKAIRGIWYAIKTQRNIKIQIIAAIIVIIISALLRLDTIEFIFITIAIMLVLITEMINTAIETAVNLYTDKYHELAKISKDVAAGAVLLTTLNAIIIAALILLGRIV